MRHKTYVDIKKYTGKKNWLTGCLFFSIASLTPHKVIGVFFCSLIAVGKLFGFVVLVSLATNVEAKKETVFYFDIPEQSLIKSLHEVSNKTETLILFPYSLVEQRRGNAVKGQFTVTQAVARLLKGSGLYSVPSSEGVMTISGQGSFSNNGKGEEKMRNKKNILAMAVGLFAGAGSVPGAFAEGVTEQGRIDEILVTATKRETSLQDTAMSISAIGGDAIAKQNLVSMDDYLRNVPGVSFQDRGAGQNSIVIRGMATNPQLDTGSTAGAYFGETPVANMRGPASLDAGGNADVKLVDIERVEVLRGPQGTLYGAGSMAGTVRIIPNAPKLDALEGSIATRYSNTADAGGDSYSVQAVINIPVIEDKLAVRGVAYRFDNSGFVDNVAASQPTGWITNAVTCHKADSRKPV